MTDSYSSDIDRFKAVCQKHVKDRGVTALLPGLDVYMFLAQLADPDELVLFDWRPDNPLDRTTSSGRILLVTKTVLIDVEYAGVVDQTHGPRQSPESAEISAISHPLSTIESLTWTAKPQQDWDTLEAGAIAVYSPNWTVRLPYTQIYSDAPGYVRNLRRHLGL